MLIKLSELTSLSSSVGVNNFNIKRTMFCDLDEGPCSVDVQLPLSRGSSGDTA